MNLQWLGVPEGDMGLLGDPRAYGAAQGLAGLSSTFGLLGAAFAPTTDPSARGRIMAGIGPASQQAMAGVRQGAMQDYAGMRARQGMDREAAIREAQSGKPDDQLSETGRQYRGLLAQIPERVRSVLPLLGEEQRGQVLAAALRPGERQNVVVSPGGALVDSMTGRPIYTAPQAPQRAPLPGAYDHLRFAPDGSLVDLRQFGGPSAAPAPQAPAAPAMPPNMPTLTPPNVGLPAPGRPSALTPNQPPPDASPAGGAPMLTPQPGDAMPAQAMPPASPALSPGTVRPPPPPQWQRLRDQDIQAEGIPAPPAGTFYERNTRTGETRRVGGSGVTVNTEASAETALARGLNSEAAKMVPTMFDEARTGVEAVRTSQRVQQLLQSGAITGTGANWRTSLERAMVTLGLVDGTRVSNTEQLISELARSVLPLAQSLKGPTSDRDIEFLRDAAAGKINLTEETLRRAASIAANYGERAVTRWNPLAEQIAADPAVPALTRRIWGRMELPQPEAFPPRREAQPSPQAVVPGLNGGAAEPPDARPVLRYNPRTMRIE